jgi:hypothetical protein
MRQKFLFGTEFSDVDFIFFFSIAPYHDKVFFITSFLCAAGIVYETYRFFWGKIHKEDETGSNFAAPGRFVHCFIFEARLKIEMNLLHGNFV